MPNEQTNDQTNEQTLTSAAASLAAAGVQAQSASVDGMSVSKTMMDPMKLVDTANALDARRASKNPVSQIRFLKIGD